MEPPEWQPETYQPAVRPEYRPDPTLKPIVIGLVVMWGVILFGWNADAVLLIGFSAFALFVGMRLHAHEIDTHENLVRAFYDLARLYGEVIPDLKKRIAALERKP